MLSHSVKTSPEDPIPARIIKNNLDLFLPIWTKLVNLSLSEGSCQEMSFPESVERVAGAMGSSPRVECTIKFLYLLIIISFRSNTPIR